MSDVFMRVRTVINYSKHLDLSVDYVKVVTQLYKPLKMHGLLEYSYGILGLKCYILIDDTLI